MKKVTVLTCVYNGLPYLREAIDSTLNQTYTDFEYLIIDDASTDSNVIKLIESYSDPRIRLIKNETNIGVSKTFNKALSLIETPYVVRLDQDDVSLPNRVKEQVAYLEENQDIDIACSWEHTIDSNGNRLRDWKRRLNNYGEFLGYILVGICPVWHPSIVFRTKSMIDAGGFKSEYTRAEDFEVTARLALKRYSASIVPKFHILQRQHSDSQSIEFEDEQASMTQRIQLEAVEFFCSNADIKLLASYLLLNISDNNLKFNKYLLNRIHTSMDDLFVNIIEKNKLNDRELKSLKNVIYRRVGFGLRYAPLITKLPSFLFYPIYYMLSPLQLISVRKSLSNFYQKLMLLAKTRD